MTYRFYRLRITSPTTAYACVEVCRSDRRGSSAATPVAAEDPRRSGWHTSTLAWAVGVAAEDTHRSGPHTSALAWTVVAYVFVRLLKCICYLLCTLRCLLISKLYLTVQSFHLRFSSHVAIHRVVQANVRSLVCSTSYLIVSETMTQWLLQRSREGKMAAESATVSTALHVSLYVASYRLVLFWRAAFCNSLLNCCLTFSYSFRFISIVQTITTSSDAIFPSRCPPLCFTIAMLLPRPTILLTRVA